MVAVLLIAGAHVPVIPLVEVVGNAPITAPEQKGPTAANVGTILGSMVTFVLTGELFTPPTVIYMLYIPL